MPRVNKSLLLAKTTEKLQFLGFNREERDAAIRSWEYAQLSEKFGHGFDRLSWLMKMVQLGKVVPNTRLVVEKNKLVYKIKGNKSLGYFAAEKAADEVIKLAKKNGIGFVTIQDCYPTGCMGQYTEAITKANLIALAITHSPPRVAPYGGTEAIFSTSGHSIGFPSNDIPYIYDTSTAAITNGEILMLHKLKKEIPKEQVLTKNGIFTKNSSDVVDKRGLFIGVITPAGGKHAHKFSGLTGALELLAGLALLNNRQEKVNSYSIFMAINPALFGNRDNYRMLVTQLQVAINNSKPQKGIQKVYFAGQQSYLKRLKNKAKKSITVSEDTYHLLFSERKTYGTVQ